MDDTVSPTTISSHLTSFFFHNKVSVSLLLAVVIIAPMTLPNLGTIIAMTITLLALLCCLKGGSIRLLGLSRPTSWPKTLLIGVAAGIGLQALFQFLLDPLFELITGSAIDLSSMDSMKGNLEIALIYVAIGWVIGGFFEELTYRSYIITRVRALVGETTVGTIIAIVLSVVPFGLAHLYQGWAGTLSAAAMGLCFALIFVYNRYNIWIPILVHGVSDMVGIALIYLDLADKLRFF